MVGNVGRSGLEVWQAGAIGKPEEVTWGRVVKEAGGVVRLRVVRFLHHHPTLEGVGLAVRHWGGEAGEARVGAAQQAGQAAGVQARLVGKQTQIQVESQWKTYGVVEDNQDMLANLGGEKGMVGRQGGGRSAA